MDSEFGFREHLFRRSSIRHAFFHDRLARSSTTDDGLARWRVKLPPQREE